MNKRPWTTDRPEPDRGAGEPGASRTVRDGLAVDRRGFLQVVGIGAAASLAACERLPVHHVLPFATAPEHVRAGQPVSYAGTCTACEARCGLMATVRDGRPIKLEGHPQDPRTRGGLCAIGQADLRALYDPGRLRGPTEQGEPTNWQTLDDALRRALADVRQRGRTVLVVTGPETGPTQRRLIESFVADRGRWIELDLRPESPVASTAAIEALTGSAARPRVDWLSTDLVVSIASDFLGTGADPVAETRGYADRRREAESRGALVHIQIEGCLSLTGAAADRRHAARSTQRRRIARHLLRAIAERVPDGKGNDVLQHLPAGAEDDSWMRRAASLAEELLAAAPAAVIVAGDDDPEVQLAIAASNALLGAIGHSLRLETIPTPSATRGIEAFREALDDEGLGAVVLVDVDPVRQLPDGERIASRLAAVPTSVAIALRPTATTRACGWVAASHHGLEAWGDHQTSADRIQVQQPMVRPLFDTRSPLECLLHWSGDEASDAITHLKQSWQANVPRPEGITFERFWHESVSAGAASLPVSVAAAAPTFDLARAATRVRQVVDTSRTSEEDLELELISEVAIRDGRRAHVSWLRELPDPLTRVSWVPVLRIAPRLAERLEVSDGDELAIEVESGTVRLPARILPGQAEDVIGLPLGYGVEPDADEVNACRLLPAAAGRGTRPITRVRRTGRREKLPLMQVWPSTEGRPIVHQVSRPGEAVPEAHHPSGGSLWPDREKKSPQWHMAIDLDACTGCGACVVACQVENNVPVVGEQGMRDHRDMHWLRIDRYFVGEPDEPDVLFEPMLCAQCDNAPCETVCPVVATAHSADGLNQQAYNRCVGTRYCANNCPYKVR
ncbi:MAG: 4Fe-4S dicluster domain-containing protein, partial [Planctomycetota bacterium]